jgi:hypothetical protein
MFFRVRIEQVENVRARARARARARPGVAARGGAVPNGLRRGQVWPGFTEDNFPLVVCKAPRPPRAPPPRFRGRGRWHRCLITARTLEPLLHHHSNVGAVASSPLERWSRCFITALTPCRQVRYLGIAEADKPSEWVPASALRKASAPPPTPPSLPPSAPPWRKHILTTDSRHTETSAPSDAAAPAPSRVPAAGACGAAPRTARRAPAR